MHTCDISLFWRDLPIFEQISLFRISKFPYITYTSPYFKFQISLFEIKNFLLCLIILPILKSKSPYLASQMYHMYVTVLGNKVRVCYRLCIRHTTECAFTLFLVSEIARCYFHIKEKCFTHILSYAAYYKH